MSLGPGIMTGYHNIPNRAEFAQEYAPDGPHQDLETLGSSFTLRASPNTDLYATPHRGHVTTAPIHYKRISSSEFKSASVTINLPFAHLYDQAGLVVILPRKCQPEPDLNGPLDNATAPQWIKAGIEFNDGLPQLSVVECETWADWSLGLLPTGAIDETKKIARYRIKLERAGTALKLFAVDGQEKRLIRKLQWTFLEENEGMWIGAYACRPATAEAVGGNDGVETEDGNFVGKGELVVQLEDLVIETA